MIAKRPQQVWRHVLSGLLTGTALLLVSGAAEAQKECPIETSPKLRRLETIPAVGGVLNTTLVVKERKRCVPTWTGSEWKGQEWNLRTYGFQKQDGTWVWSSPGPTLLVHKPATPYGKGDRIKIRLVNELPKETTMGCDDPCPPEANCSGAKPPECCKARTQQPPNCFHGDNTTNLHFHGTHVSPQEHQDYVLVEVLPKGSPAPGHGCEPSVVGEYQYSLDPLPWTQAEGTHWYHPHKHGSVALQVLNGMAGALIIEGPFDAWIRDYYLHHGSKLEEKLLVIQQLAPKVNFFTDEGAKVPAPLVNGQPSPVIEMCAGEVQRWRFVSATMQGSAQLSIDFNGPRNDQRLTAKQIAMDGVQFAPENYAEQPLLSSSLQSFGLSPGNRADFLVKLPDDSPPGMLSVTYDIIGSFAEKRRKNVDFLESSLRGAAGNPSLLQVKVKDCRKSMSFVPDNEWAAMPAYLRNIDKVTGPSRSLWFDLQGGQASPTSKFFIDLKQGENRQFCPCCVDITSKLDSTEEWTITNTTDADPFHIFHIHTNPFQVVQNGDKKFKPPYIWQDSVALPSSEKPPVIIRQRFEEFTGRYVLHCHFLGHEDRGMMLGVQVVCPQKPDSFGKARADGKPECVEGNFIPAAMSCPEPYSCPKEPDHSH